MNAKSLFLSFGLLASSSSLHAAELFSCDNSAYDLLNFSLEDGKLAPIQADVWENLKWTADTGEVFGWETESAHPRRIWIKEMQALQQDDKTIVGEATNVPAQLLHKEIKPVTIDRVSLKIERQPAEEGREPSADVELTIEENGQTLVVQKLSCIIEKGRTFTIPSL